MVLFDGRAVRGGLFGHLPSMPHLQVQEAGGEWRTTVELRSPAHPAMKKGELRRTSQTTQARVF